MLPNYCENMANPQNEQMSTDAPVIALARSRHGKGEKRSEKIDPDHSRSPRCREVPEGVNDVEDEVVVLAPDRDGKVERRSEDIDTLMRGEWDMKRMADVAIIIATKPSSVRSLQDLLTPVARQLDDPLRNAKFASATDMLDATNPHHLPFMEGLVAASAAPSSAPATQSLPNNSVAPRDDVSTDVESDGDVDFTDSQLMSQLM